jgi:hypothetical protein
LDVFPYIGKFIIPTDQLIFLGGGRLSLDAFTQRRRMGSPSVLTGVGMGGGIIVDSCGTVMGYDWVTSIPY